MRPSPGGPNSVWRCLNPQAKKIHYNSVVSLQSSIVTKCGSSLNAWTILHRCHTHWVNSAHLLELTRYIPKLAFALASQPTVAIIDQGTTEKWSVPSAAGVSEYIMDRDHTKSWTLQVVVTGPKAVMGKQVIQAIGTSTNRCEDHHKEMLRKKSNPLLASVNLR
jgi:hypothetical protein